MIESRKNRYIKQIRRLGRQRGDRALLEGPHLVGEALAAGLRLDPTLATPDFLAAADPELLEALDPAPLPVAPALLAELTDADSPRGLLAVARLPRGGAADLPLAEAGVWLFLAGLQDPGNLGAIARVGEATGIAGLALAPGSVHPNHPRALRGSAGSLLRLPVAVDVDPAALAERLAPLGPTWVALSSSDGSDLYARPPSPPLVLVIGAERGLPEPLAARCASRLHIPMAPPVESLNTAVAVALALYEVRRRDAPHG